MADLSKIKLNGTTYNFKDNTAREMASLKVSFTCDDFGEWACSEQLSTIVDAINSGRPITAYIGSPSSVNISRDYLIGPYYTYDSNTQGSALYFYGYYSPNTVKQIIYQKTGRPPVESITSNQIELSTFSGSYNDLTNKPAIPTNVSSLTNDAGYQTSSNVQTAITNALGNVTGFSVEVVQSLPATGEQGVFYFVSNSGSGNNIYDEYVYVNNAFEKIGTTEIDLSNYLQTTDIAAWAKAANKPSYTASEVGAVATTAPAAAITSTDISTWNAKSDFSGSYDDLTNKPTIPTVPTNVSAFTNDSGYLTSYTETDPVYSASAAAGITAGDISNWNAKSDFSGSYEDLTNKPTIPTVPSNVSAFTNDAGYLTSFTETDPVFAASAAAGISSSDITNWNSKTNNTGTVTSVRVQATSPVVSSTNTAQSTTLNTTISLASGYGDTQNPYASKTAKYVLAAPNAQNGVPTFRALVASDLPSIGNITNAGDITTNATIASGDRLIINDESASKVINSSITFGTSTTQYLANNGTWQNAYDDTALAARVTALENLEWATYYSGRSNPSDSQGQNGDIYLQY